MPDVTTTSPATTSPVAGDEVHPERAVADADHDALHAGAFDDRAGGGVAVDEQLHQRRPGRSAA